jgi:uncharacterized protein YjbJ (UPF0337 family)
MNWDQLEGQWAQTKSAIKAKWAKLTNDDLTALEAKKDALVGKIQERYGIMKDAAEKQVDEWIAALPPTHGHKTDDDAAMRDKGRSDKKRSA